MKRVTAILSVGFLLAMTGSMALGFVPEPILWLDAADNPAHPDGWTNLGTAGGVMPTTQPPDLEPAAGPDGTPTYTATPGQCFGPEGGPSLIVEDWTLEAWAIRYGPAEGESEHHFIVMADMPWPFTQCITLRFAEGGEGAGMGPFTVMIVGTDSGGVDNTQHISTNVDIGKNEWHHLAFTFDDSDGMFRSYLDGKPVGEDETIQDYSAGSPMKIVNIFGNTGEPHRTFNGSISIIRLYDWVLNDDEILGNFNSPRTIAVEPADKLAETWGKVKMSH